MDPFLFWGIGFLGLGVEVWRSRFVYEFSVIYNFTNAR